MKIEKNKSALLVLYITGSFGKHVDGQQYIHHNSYHFKYVKIPMVYSQPLSMRGIIVL